VPDQAGFWQPGFWKLVRGYSAGHGVIHFLLTPLLLLLLACSLPVLASTDASSEILRCRFLTVENLGCGGNDLLWGFYAVD